MTEEPQPEISNTSLPEISSSGTTEEPQVVPTDRQSDLSDGNLPTMQSGKSIHIGTNTFTPSHFN